MRHRWTLSELSWVVSHEAMGRWKTKTRRIQVESDKKGGRERHKKWIWWGIDNRRHLNPHQYWFSVILTFVLPQENNKKQRRQLWDKFCRLHLVAVFKLDNTVWQVKNLRRRKIGTMDAGNLGKTQIHCVNVWRYFFLFLVHPHMTISFSFNFLFKKLFVSLFLISTRAFREEQEKSKIHEKSNKSLQETICLSKYKKKKKCLANRDEMKCCAIKLGWMKSVKRW